MSPVVYLFLVDCLLEALAELGKWLRLSIRVARLRFGKVLLLYTPPFSFQLFLFPAASQILARHRVQLGLTLPFTQVVLLHSNAACLVLSPGAMHGCFER